MENTQMNAGLPRVRIPIRVKITLPYLILASLLALGAAFVITQVVIDTIAERFTNQLVESGKMAAEWMVKDENSLLENLRLLTHIQGLPAALEQRDAKGLQSLLLGIAANHQIEAIEILDGRGDLVLSYHHRDSGLPEDYVPSTVGGDKFLPFPFVQNVVKGQADALGDKYAGLISTREKNFLYIAGRILNPDGTQAGSLLIGQSLPELARQMRAEIYAQVTLYDLAGQPLFSTFPAPQSLNSTLVRAIVERQEEGSLRRSLNSNPNGSADRMNYTELLAPWEVRQGTDIGVMGVSLTESFLVNTSRITRIQIGLLVALSLLLVIFLGVNVANLVTRPLIGLVRASTEVAHGNLNVRVDTSSQDEVALLADTFNHMTASLSDSKQDLLRTYDSTLEGWSRALELRDDETKGHSQRVTEATLKLARAMGIAEADLLQIRRGALLHDIGKMGVPDAILLKPGTLTEEETAIMHRHPRYAFEMLEPIEYLRPALDIPYCHHERWDGNGYPRGLKGIEIPIAARIFSVIDVWDAMLSDRPYHAAYSLEAVLQYLRAESSTQFDPQVVDAFLRIFYPAGQPAGG